MLLRSLSLGFVFALLACGKGGGSKVISADAAAATNSYIEIYQTWRDSDGNLELRVQVRNGNERSDLISFDGEDRLKLEGIGELTKAEKTPSSRGQFENTDAFEPLDLHYVYQAAGQENGGQTLVWERAGVSHASIKLLPVNVTPFQSYEYCSSVGRNNYALLRFKADAPPTDLVCATIQYGCFSSGSCDGRVKSCNVTDYRLVFEDAPDRLGSVSRLRARLQRTTTVDSLDGFKAAEYSRRFDTGDFEIKDSNFCVKP